MCSIKLVYMSTSRQVHIKQHSDMLHFTITRLSIFTLRSFQYYFNYVSGFKALPSRINLNVLECRAEYVLQALFNENSKVLSVLNAKSNVPIILSEVIKACKIKYYAKFPTGKRIHHARKNINKYTENIKFSVVSLILKFKSLFITIF